MGSTAIVVITRNICPGVTRLPRRISFQMSNGDISRKRNGFEISPTTLKTICSCPDSEVLSTPFDERGNRDRFPPRTDVTKQSNDEKNLS